MIPDRPTVTVVSGRLKEDFLKKLATLVGDQY